MSDLFGIPASQANFRFESRFDPFSDYVRGEPNASDVVICDSSGQDVRALEIKLTVVPDSQTLKSPRAEQASEFVTRPVMIELLATNICRAFGSKGRQQLNSQLLEGLGNPNNWDWRNESEMLPRLGRISDALSNVIRSQIAPETPMVIHPIWRTIGDSMRLDQQCFDCFAWSDFALAGLYARAALENARAGSAKRISREARSAVWLCKMLWDYSTAGQLTMSDVVAKITYSTQQDKAGAFGGKTMLRYLKGSELENPRIERESLPDIIGRRGADFLNPERRLDATIFMESKIIDEVTA